VINDNEVEIAVIGAGIAGIATAYYLCVEHSHKSVLLIDSRQPMSYTSAQSGDNYRNWWPHRTMTDFTNDSINELDRFARDSGNVFNMTRGGYCLASRQQDVAHIVNAIPGEIDADVISGSAKIRQRFPALSPDIESIIHIRRGGDISGQQLGQYLLHKFLAAGGRRIQGDVQSINSSDRYELQIQTNRESNTIGADAVVNAAGPFAGKVANMLGVNLPIENIYQQKIAFEDSHQAIPRDMPFSIDLDPKQLNWSDEESALLAADEEMAWLTQELPAGTHCRPDGGERGKWVKLGWAYNASVSTPQEDLANELAIDATFPEIVIRGAAELIPSLRSYIAEPPATFSHYGGYYTMTEENWPLIGPLDNKAAFVNGALSGFGSMAACAAGKLCAAHVSGKTLPSYAADLSLDRYANLSLMTELRTLANKGLL
jgi:glycine/D-amino acid oxidase-like deaminating enzyme